MFGWICSTGQVSDGDRLEAFEAVIGSPFADLILGSSLMNILAGRGGNDVIRGLVCRRPALRRDGNDRLDGGPGVTTSARAGPAPTLS